MRLWLEAVSGGAPRPAPHLKPRLSIPDEISIGRPQRRPQRRRGNPAHPGGSRAGHTSGRGGAGAVCKSSELLLRDAHVSVRFVSVVVGVGIPEAAAAHPHALPSLFTDHHLDDELIPRQLQLLLYAALDAIGDLARPLRRQLLVVSAGGVRRAEVRSPGVGVTRASARATRGAQEHTICQPGTQQGRCR